MKGGDVTIGKIRNRDSKDEVKGVDKKCKRKRSEVDAAKRHRRYVIHKAINEYSDTGRNDDAQRIDVQKDKGVDRPIRESGVRRTDNRDRQTLLYNNGKGRTDMVKDPQGYSCYLCEGGLDYSKCVALQKSGYCRLVRRKK